MHGDLVWGGVAGTPSGKLTDHRTRTCRHSGPAEPRSGGRTTDHDPAVIAFFRRVRRALPGDPHFGDRLSAAGSGGPEAAARAAERMLGDRDAASRELSLATLQVWQAIRERRSGRAADEEITLVFTDLVGFFEWTLRAGDDAMLRLLRWGRVGRRTAGAGSRRTGPQAYGLRRQGRYAHAAPLITPKHRHSRRTISSARPPIPRKLIEHDHPDTPGPPRSVPRSGRRPRQRYRD